MGFVYPETNVAMICHFWLIIHYYLDKCGIIIVIKSFNPPRNYHIYQEVGDIVTFQSKWGIYFISLMPIAIIPFLIYENGWSMEIIGASCLFILFDFFRMLVVNKDNQPTLHLMFMWLHLGIAFLITCFDLSFLSSIFLYFLIAEMALTYRMRQSLLYTTAAYLLYALSRLIVLDFPTFHEWSFIIPRMLEFAVIYIAFYFVKITKDQKEELSQAYQKLDESSKEVDRLLIENERIRISKDIHDSVGHTLTSTIIGIETAKKVFHKNSKNAFVLLDSIQASAQHSLEEVRSIVHKMKHQDTFTNYRQAIIHLLVSTEEKTGIQIHKDIPSSIPIQSPDAKMAVYHMLQEGLTNGLRHGKADHFHCVIMTDNQTVVIRLEDNGGGFEAGREEGFGLHAMKERIEASGGDLHIESIPSEGTSLICKLPVEKERGKTDGRQHKSSRSG